MRARLQGLKAATRSRLTRAAGRVGLSASTSSTLSLCIITSGRPEQVRLLLEAWRPHVDEVVLALDERGPCEEIASAAGGLADRIAVLPAMPNMERYLGWVHRQCTGEWILRVDDDELPSQVLLEALPSMLSESELTHFWMSTPAQRASRTTAVRSTTTRTTARNGCSVCWTKCRART